MDKDKSFRPQLPQMDSYFQHLVSLIPPRNYYSQTADEDETAGQSSDIEDDVGLLAKVLKKSSHIKTISKKDGKLIKPMKQESKHKQQEGKKKPADGKGIKKLSKKRLMRREDIVEIIKKQKADDSGVETIGSVDLEDSKERVAKSDDVVRESSRLEVLGDEENTVDVTKPVSVGLDSFEEGKGTNTVKKEHKIKQFKVPEEGKQGKDKKIESVQTENEKVNKNGETSKSKKKKQKREELETDLGDSVVDDTMGKLEVLVEKKLNKHEQQDKQDTLPVEGEQNGEVEEKVIPGSDKLKVSSKKKKKKREEDQEREVEKESEMEVVPLEGETSKLKRKKKKGIIEDQKDTENGGQNDDQGGEEEMVLDLGDFKMSDLSGTMGDGDEGKEEAGDGTKVGSLKKQESQDFLELREKMRSKIKSFEMQRKAKDGNEKKNKQKKLKAKLKKMKKQKKKEALAAKKGLKKQEEGKDVTQKSEGSKEKGEETEEQKEENKLQFSQLEFDNGTITGTKKKSKKTKNMVENQTGKNYKVLLDKVERKKEKYERLKAVDPVLAVDWLSQEKWRKAVLKAQGEKIKDDPELLKKSLKRTEKRKKRSRQKMKEMKDRVLKDKEERQKKRNRNLKEKQEKRKAKKTKRLQKKGKLLLADRDKI